MKRKTCAATPRERQRELSCVWPCSSRITQTNAESFSIRLSSMLNACANSARNAARMFRRRSQSRNHWSIATPCSDSMSGAVHRAAPPQVPSARATSAVSDVLDSRRFRCRGSRLQSGPLTGVMPQVEPLRFAGQRVDEHTDVRGSVV